MKQIMAFSSLIGLPFVICSDEFDSDFNTIYAALNRLLNFLITNIFGISFQSSTRARACVCVCARNALRAKVYSISK